MCGGLDTANKHDSEFKVVHVYMHIICTVLSWYHALLMTYVHFLTDHMTHLIS